MSPTANGSERAVQRRKTKYLRAAVAAAVMLAALPLAAEPLGAQSDGADAVAIA